MALPMTLIIIAGEIDLSVESMAGLASAILGFLWAAGVPLVVGDPVVLVVGALGGLLNGLLVTGRAAVARRDPRAPWRSSAAWPWSSSDRMASATSRPSSPTSASGPSRARRSRGRSSSSSPRGRPGHRPARTWVGRQIYAVGKNPEASRYSGVRVARLKMGLFVLSGTVAALAGVILTPAFVERPRRHRPGHDPDRGDDRAARRGQHLRWSRHASRASSWPSSRWPCCGTCCA